MNGSSTSGAMEMAAEREALLESEKPESADWEDAYHWRAIYTHLVRFETDLLDRLAAGLEQLSAGAVMEVERDLVLVRARIAGDTARLEYWDQRLGDLKGFRIDPVRRVVSFRGREAFLSEWGCSILSRLVQDQDRHVPVEDLVRAFGGVSELSLQRARHEIMRLRRALLEIDSPCEVKISADEGVAVLFCGQTEPGAPGRPLRVASLRTDVARFRLQSALDRRVAATDALTGCLSRSAGLAAIQRAAFTKVAGAAAVAAFVDLDGLKVINDTRGHAAGDAALVALGRALRRTMGTGAVIARMGGDEFICFLPGSTLGEAERNLATVNALLADGDVAASISYGMTEMVAGENIDSVLERADRELIDGRRRSPHIGIDRGLLGDGQPGATRQAHVRGESNSPPRRQNRETVPSSRRTGVPSGKD